MTHLIDGGVDSTTILMSLLYTSTTAVLSRSYARTQTWLTVLQHQLLHMPANLQVDVVSCSASKTAALQLIFALRTRGCHRCWVPTLHTQQLCRWRGQAAQATTRWRWTQWGYRTATAAWLAWWEVCHCVGGNWPCAFCLSAISSSWSAKGVYYIYLLLLNALFFGILDYFIQCSIV